MATKTFTIDTGEWLYPDSSGITHAVTNAETFTLTLTDGGAAAVTYANDLGGTLLCLDKSRVNIRPQATQSVSTNNGSIRTWGPTADAQDGVTLYGLAGEFVAEHDGNNVTQYWKPVTVNINDVDAPTTITAKFEDQFGNSFTWTGVTIS